MINIYKKNNCTFVGGREGSIYFSLNWTSPYEPISKYSGVSRK